MNRLNQQRFKRLSTIKRSSHRRILSSHRILLFLFLLSISTFSFATDEPLLLSVNLNGEQLSTIILGYYDKKTEQLYIPESTLASWAVSKPSETPIIINQNRYYELNWFRGVRYAIDKRSLQLTVMMPTKYFQSQHFNGDAMKKPMIIRSKRTGYFLNYDASIQSTNTLQATTLGATTELGMFSPYGIGSTSFLLQNIGSQNQVKRLDTSWRLDQPEKMRTIIFGDAMTSTNNWSQSVRFAGLKFSSNPETQPNQVTFPLPTASGEAIVPSAVSLFVNNALVQQQYVEPGSYTINNIPTVTGAGNIEMVTKNILGQQQMTVIPYYVSPNLMKKGKNNYSWELGFTRRNYGIQNFDYGRAVAVGTFDRGLSNYFTLGTHIEALQNQQTGGLSGYYLLDHYAVINGSVAASHAQHQYGDLKQIGIEREANPINYGVNSTWTSSEFQQLGYQLGTQPPARTTQAFMGYTQKKLGSFGLSYTFTQSRSAPAAASSSATTVPNASFLTFNYSREFTHRFNFSASSIIDLSSTHNNQFFVSLVWSLDATRSVFVNSTQTQTGLQNSIQYSKNRVGADGVGYRFSATDARQLQMQGSVNWQSQYGNYNAQYARVDKTNNFELDGSGSVLYFDKHFFMSRSLSSSFALVHVPGVYKVPVYYENQYVGKTNKQGNLIIQNLLPYQKNKIDLDFKHVNLDTDISRDEEYVIPYYHSGVVANFSVTKMRPVTLHLEISTHDYVPAGASVILDQDQSNQLPVGYLGTVFVENAKGDFVDGIAQWDNHQCRFHAMIPAQNKPIVQIGNVACSVF